jgi:DNA-binding response OmpR family regulator
MNLRTETHCGGKRILLVDDEAHIQDLCQILLENRDYLVDRVADGEQALRALNNEQYELLITDHLMPNLTGVELARQLRARGNQIPAILISGDLPVQEPDLRQLFSGGALLAKPFSISQFLAAVDDTLR